MDGKDVRGALKRVGKERRMMVAAVEYGSGLVLGQVQIGAKTNEIPAVRELSRQLDLAGRVVTVDAMHAQHETARCLTEDCEADCVVTGVKDNQPTNDPVGGFRPPRTSPLHIGPSEALWQKSVVLPHLARRTSRMNLLMFDEDRSGRNRRDKRRLAMRGEFKYTNRHYAARPQDALDAILAAGQP